MEIYGDERDKFQYKTEWVPNNGFNPFWDDYTEIVVSHPDVAMIRFSVWDKDAITSNNFLGQYCLPLTCCQVGYRHINLEDENGRALRPASIFVHIDFEVLEKFDVTERKRRSSIVSSIGSSHKQNSKKTIELGKFLENYEYHLGNVQFLERRRSFVLRRQSCSGFLSKSSYFKKLKYVWQKTVQPQIYLENFDFHSTPGYVYCFLKKCQTFQIK